MDDEMFTLENGIKMSNICFGTPIVDLYKYGKYNKLIETKYYISNFLKNREQFRKDVSLPNIIKKAYSLGIVTFDTSRAYAGAECVLGNVLNRYSRDSYIIVTKLRNKDQYNKDIRRAFEKSLKELNMDYIDVYLMHWPVKDMFVDSWKQMEKIYDEGLCKAIGVCNFNEHHFEELSINANIKPMINQFELHPLFTQNKLFNYCKNNNIQIMSYTSTARGDERLLKTPIKDIARKYNKSITQIILRWHQQKGCIPIFNSSNIHHVESNADIKDFTLTDCEIELINSVNINSRLRYDPDNCDFTKL